MKHLLIFLLAFPFFASAQILEKQFVATVQYGGFTQINDSLYRGDLNEFRDVLIEGYQPSGVDSGFICLDGTGRAYRVEVVNSFDYSSLNVDLIELDDYDEIPIGVGIVAERYGSTYQIPNGLVNSIGISSVLQAKILNHNTKIAATTVQPPDTLYLKEASGITAISDGDTIDVSPYLFKSDTAAMLLNYPSTAGYGIIDAGKIWKADTTSPNGLATRLFAKTLPTNIAANYAAVSNGTNLVARNLFDNNTYAGVISRPWKFGEYTTAGLPAGVDGYVVKNITTGFTQGYFTSQWENYITSIGASSGQVGYFTSAGKIAGNNNFFWDITNSRLGLWTTTPSHEIHVRKSVNSGVQIHAENTTSGTGAWAGMRLTNNTGNPAVLFKLSSLYTTYKNQTANAFGMYNFGSGNMSFLNDVSAGNINFWTGLGAAPQFTIEPDGDLFATGKLGIGLTPTSIVDVRQDQNAPTRMVIQNQSTGANAWAGMSMGNSTGGWSVYKLSSGYTTYKTQMANDAGFINTVSGNLTFLNDWASGKILFTAGASSTQHVSIDATGFVAFGNIAATERIDVDGDARIRDSLRVATTPAHTSITGLLTRDANGWVGATTFGNDLKYSSGVLGLKRKTLIDSLPLASVTIDANANDLTIDNLTNLDFGTDGGNGSMQLNDESFEVEANDLINLSTGTDAQLRLDNEVELHAPNLEGVNRMRIDSAGFHYSFVNTSALTDSAMTLFTDYDRGLLKLHKYGKDNHTSSTTGEYPVRVAGISSSGYVQDFRLARDTFIEDVTLFSVGTLMSDCQELTIVSSMTSIAPTNQEIRFPDAADYLRGKKIIVYSKKKDAGAFVPYISVVGGVSRLFYTTNPGIGGTDPTSQATLSIDDSTWSDHGTTFEFTCLKIDNTPSYRWVLKQR